MYFQHPPPETKRRVKDSLSEQKAARPGTRAVLQISSTTTQRALERHGCAFVIPAMGTLCPVGATTGDTTATPTWQKALHKRAKASKEPMACTPACLHVSLLHHLTPEFIPVVSMQDQQKKAALARMAGRETSFSWMNQASLIFSDTQVMLRIACPLAQTKLKGSRNEEALRLIPTTFPSQTASTPSQIPPGIMCSNRSSDAVGKTTRHKMRR